MNNDQRIHTGIWAQTRRVLLFQLKLAFDALRDLFLSPVSIVAYLLDLSEGKNSNGRYFDRLLQLGRRSERLINLFDQHKDDTKHNVDKVFTQMEDIIVNEYQKGEVSAAAKKTLQKSLDLINQYRQGANKNKRDGDNSL